MTEIGQKNETFIPMDAAINLICRAVKHERVQKSLENHLMRRGLLDPIVL